MKMWDIDDLATTGDLAKIFHVATPTVAIWPTRYPSFPAEITIKGGLRLFSIIEVRAWHKAWTHGEVS